MTSLPGAEWWRGEAETDPAIPRFVLKRLCNDHQEGSHMSFVPKVERFTVFLSFVFAGVFALAAGPGLSAQEKDIAKRLQGFDAYMAKILKDWNAPAVGVGIVAGDKLVFAKGYGYRDYENKVPFTATTLCQIASNTKLFTAVAAGLLVDEGKLTWDKPVRGSVPTIQFYNDQLNNTVTLRDMLAHRTGITRHDTIWYKSDFSRLELFERLKFLEPQEPLRQTFLYNNLMYAGVGYLIELQSGKTWEEFVRQRIFTPLKMMSTVYSIADMLKQPDRGVPFTERRDTTEIYRIPYYEDIAGVGPCGAIISNMEDISHWLIALMNEGKYEGRQVLPPGVLKATLEPAISLPNTMAETFGFWEILNTAYGMGREAGSYRGHLLTFHGGDLPGFHSQISFMPREKLGVIVFVIGNHCSVLYNIVSYNVYERLLGLDQTPWSSRFLEMRLKGKQAGKEARAKAGGERVPDTKPSHALGDFAGEYEHPAYGILKVRLKDGQLEFDFHKIVLPLAHFHYDRFDTPNDELYGKWSVNFQTNPQGDVDKALMSLDEAEAIFTRKPAALDPELLNRVAGTYETPTGARFQVILKADNSLYLKFPGENEQKLIPYKGFQFRIKEFSDVVFEFAVEKGQVTALKQRDPSGEYVFRRK
jgi:CubicO group peptidase (beta-lactamase class C family)